MAPSGVPAARYLCREPVPLKPVGRPGEIQDRLAIFKAGNPVDHQCVIFALIVGDGIAQAVFGQMMLDNTLAAPAEHAACQIGFAITIRVEFCANRRVFQITE